MRFLFIQGIILISTFLEIFSATDRTNDDGIYMFPDFLQTRLFTISFRFTLTCESDQTIEVQRSLLVSVFTILAFRK